MVELGPKVAVIVEVPKPATVTVDPEIVATERLLET